VRQTPSVFRVKEVFAAHGIPLRDPGLAPEPAAGGRLLDYSSLDGVLQMMVRSGACTQEQVDGFQLLFGPNAKTGTGIITPRDGLLIAIGETPGRSGRPACRRRRA